MPQTEIGGGREKARGGRERESKRGEGSGKGESGSVSKSLLYEDLQ